MGVLAATEWTAITFGTDMLCQTFYQRPSSGQMFNYPTLWDMTTFLQNTTFPSVSALLCVLF